MNIFEKDKNYILNVYKRLPLEVVKGKGCYLYDKKNRYLDMFSGIAVNSLGYNNKKINSAITKQLKKYLHLSNYFVNENVSELANLLVINSFASKCFFSNSGTEANEAALKLARAYGKTIDKDKVEIITLNESFHGRTYGGLSLTGQINKKKKFTPVLDKIIHVNRNDVEDLKSKVNSNTAAIFLELIQGESGVNLLTKEFIEEVKRLANEYIFLIIIDEVQTGLMRTGNLFAYEKFKIIPDIITLAKALGGGLPLGAMLVTKKLENVLNIGDHGSTFGGNPLASAAGCEVFKTIINTEFKNKVNLMSIYIMDELKLLKEEYPNLIHDVRGIGLIIGIDVGKNANLIQQKMLDSKVLINVTNKNIIRLLPPLILNRKHIDEFINKLKNVLKEIECKNV